MTMNKTGIHIKRGDAFKQLMPRIEGKVFHVSKMSNWPSIEKLKKILPNRNGKLETTFGSSTNSYFKNKNCVSVFDYRKINEEEPQEHIHKCRPTKPLTPEDGIIIFVLGKEYHDKLMAWDGWKQDDLRQMVVPHVEAGYPGAIELSQIEEAIFVTIDENENSILSKALEKIMVSR